MAIKRIVSFLPTGTELIYALGAENLLFGVTHECIFPKEAQEKSQIISTSIDSDNLSSNEINNETCRLLHEGKDIFILDKDNLRKANPDLIITQETCEVCAPHTNLVKEAVQFLPEKPLIFSMDPHSLEEIVISVTHIGEILGQEKKAKKIRQNLEKKILKIKNVPKIEKPKILAIEWMEPLFTAGHWIPEMIEIAGGKNLISKKEEHSRIMQIEEIAESDPDIIVLMPCGFTIKRTVEEYNKILRDNKNWNQLKAVQSKNIFAVDANSFFSKPSIRTITGLEILAKIIQPENFKDLIVPDYSFLHMD